MLERLQPQPGSRRRRKRVGRGPGSGHHKTSGRGMKGQGKRSSGRETPAYFEGGQMPLVRRVPKRGFHHASREGAAVVNVGALAVFGDGARVDVETLAARGLVKPGVKVKLLGDGDAPKKLVVQVHRASASARAKVEQAGGTLEILT
jgi:large subunit ribosomal protein L15